MGRVVVNDLILGRATGEQDGRGGFVEVQKNPLCVSRHNFSCTLNFST
jgi:hypothetical protein